MRVIGFNFTKISAEKLKTSVEKVKIGTGIDISDIKEIRTSLLKTKDEILEAKFTFNINYDPGFASVVLEGKVIVSLDPKTAREALKQWKKKQIPHDLKAFLVNVVIRKASLKALSLEDEMGLPLHMPMPQVRKNQER